MKKLLLMGLSIGFCGMQASEPPKGWFSGLSQRAKNYVEEADWTKRARAAVERAEWGKPGFTGRLQAEWGKRYDDAEATRRQVEQAKRAQPELYKESYAQRTIPADWTRKPTNRPPVISEPSRFQQLMSWWKRQPQSEPSQVTGQKFLGRYGQEGVGELPQFYQQERVERPQTPMGSAQKERLAQWEQRKQEIDAEVAREMERGKAMRAEIGSAEYEQRLKNLSNALGEANRTYDRVIREEEQARQRAAEEAEKKKYYEQFSTPRDRDKLQRWKGESLEQSAKRREARSALQEQYYEQFGIPRDQYREIKRLNPIMPSSRGEE